ncbi:RNA-binding cell elongation regulator Jag/EloR [Tumebacillus flagellatus]|uniref:RNA-binding protein KhpB n=1 Tax=Tumebacillus flagellatus TaxID=1157490 RepID=A0A074LKZ6_9BACL|nr:RNA-binding cell elongation regulator Jag/EloR [Tumebacillus flagellatus]KEO81220.1 hypothetical protein EL26_22040 [Tumebacillus flagellatus]
MKKVITTGKTVELATELALNKLGVSRDRVNITILTQPSRGLFGLFGKRDAEIEVEVIEEAPAVVAAPPVVATVAPTAKQPIVTKTPAPATTRDPILEARKFLDEVLAAMNLSDIAVTVEEEQDHTHLFRLHGESIGMLIGRRGATLDSLQTLVNLVANKHSEKFLRVQLDAEDYRSRRKETLERLADRLAKKAVQTRREVVLEPMGNSERKVIHAYLQHRSDVTTHSLGEEPYRKVVITPRGVTPSHSHKPRHPRKSEGANPPRKSNPRRQGQGRGNKAAAKSTNRSDRDPAPNA